MGRVGKLRPSLGQAARLGMLPLLGKALSFRQDQMTLSGGKGSSSTGLTLNPQFVEMLMGLPVGWTDCALSAMASSRNKQHLLSQNFDPVSNSGPGSDRHRAWGVTPKGEQMANVFKKLSKFEATIEVAGQDVEAAYFEGGLSLKVDADLALAILNHLGRLRGERKARVPRQPKPQPARPSPYVERQAGPPDPPIQGSTPPARADRRTKEPPLPTPDELKAKRDAKARAGDRQEPKAQAAAEDPPPAAEALPDAVEQVAAEQDGQFVEDLETHKAADAAKLVADGKAKVPDALLNAPKLRSIVAWMMDTYKMDATADVLEACKAWRPHVPKLRDIPDESFKARVSNQVEVENADRAKGGAGAA